MKESKTCAKCGAEFRGGSSEVSVCPACLLERGIASDETRDGDLDFDSTTQAFEGEPGKNSPPPDRGAPSPAAKEEVGRRQVPSIEVLEAEFPDLEILELIGRGGMGAVYKARQESLDRLVALKVLPGEWKGEGSVRERFRREAKTLAALCASGRARRRTTTS